MCVGTTRSRRRAPKGRRLGRGDEAFSERTSLVRGRFGKKRDFSSRIGMLELIKLEIRVVACGLRRVRRLDEADLREFARS